MSNENSKARGITVTIKGKGDKADPWAVFYGSPTEIRDDLTAFFGLDSYTTEQRTLHELVQLAAKIASGAPMPAGMQASSSSDSEAEAEARAMKLLKDELGAKPVAEGTTAEDVWANASSSPSEPPWPTDDKPAVNPMLAQIDACTSVDALKKLWAANQAAFADGSLMDAYKAKGRALKAAA
ncbi:hypothetical protein [Lentzea sp. NEAU-D7]|uniref:hypothetical protein n=1 Tax=Lentzea sp. NEAU-D7 TaxID=2994667 RepID=UPI00224B12CE|nr:hypothetical protein [Lentzea sp. NEAU-D7]MCX2949953.1 hypothetical protein [Lentzea sp. NEAU-D7]